MECMPSKPGTLKLQDQVMAVVTLVVRGNVVRSPVLSRQSQDSTLAVRLDLDDLWYLGRVVQAIVRIVVTQATLPEYPGDAVEGTAHGSALVERFAHYAMAIRANMA